MATLFGWELRFSKAKQQEQNQPEIAVPVKDDGAIVVEGAVGGAYGTYVDLDQTARNDAELITRYRGMALQPEIDQAVTEIKNEAIVEEETDETVELNLDEVDDIPSDLSEVMDEEFDRILDLLEFRSKGQDVFCKWYVDGRIYYQIQVDQKNLGQGIIGLRNIDPRKIRKVREVKKIRQGGEAGQGFELTQTVKEYYIFNEQGFENRAKPGLPQPGNIVGLRIAKDGIAYVPSGLTDPDGKMVLGYLHKAIRPLNMYRAISDAAIISRLSRAPDRRVFYIDVGNLPRLKAEQYIREQMNRYRNKLKYDSVTGQIRDDRQFTTMQEDIWLPRRNGEKSTEISNLDGLQNDGITEDVLMFAKILNRSLNVPVARLEPENITTGITGRIGEITREEVNFQKFIDRLRTKFSELFTDLLGKQLILKGIVTPDEWDDLKPKIRYRWARDNSFAEQKDLDIMLARLEVLDRLMPYAGRYISNTTIRRKIMRQTDEEMREEDELIEEEALNPQYMQVDPETGALIPPPSAAEPPIPGGPDAGPGGLETKMKSKLAPDKPYPGPDKGPRPG